MSLYRMVQMILRGSALVSMLFALYYNWETPDLTATPYFMMSGIFGGFSVVTFGLILEAGLDKSSDTCIEVAFLFCGIILNVVASVLAFIEYYDPNTALRASATSKVFLALVNAVIYGIDIAFMYC